MKRTCFVLFAAMILCVGTFAQTPKIEGVWRAVEVNITGPNAETNTSPQPSLYIFTKKHYSIIYVSAKAPRTVLADLSKATADELRTVFVDSFVANAGTYEFKNGKLTTTPLVAKNPSFMEAGAFITSNVKMDGKNLVLTGESNRQGPITNPVTVKLVRVE